MPIHIERFYFLGARLDAMNDLRKTYIGFGFT